MNFFTENVSFEGSDHQKLAGVVHHAIGEAQAYAIYAHCFTCTKEIPVAARICESLRTLGITTLRFDFTGLGHSEGVFEKTTFSTNLADLQKAAEWMEQTIAQPTVLIGHSLGGAAILHAIPKLSGIKAAITIAAPYEPAHVAHLFTYLGSKDSESPVVSATLGTKTYTMPESFIGDLQQHPSYDVIGQIGIPLLIMHSPQDQIVGIDNARKIYEAAKHPKSFISLHDANHLLTRKKDSDYVADSIQAWLRYYLPRPKTQRLKKGSVSIEGSYKPFTQHIHTSEHLLIADEPKSIGGEALGPTPYEYLLSALGACTSMTMQMYAKRKGWPLHAVHVQLEHHRDYMRDCEDCENAETKIEAVTKKIYVEGPLSNEQKTRLIDISSRCPVHRTLSNTLHIESKMIESPS